MTKQQIDEAIKNHLQYCRGDVVPSKLWANQAFFCCECGSNWPPPDDAPKERHLKLVPSERATVSNE